MNVSMIQPGDKIDIQLVQQIANADKTGTGIDTYKSQVLDVLKNGNLEISMPTESGKLILLSLGARYEFAFYSGGGIYKSIGRVAERYKRDNLYMLVIELKTPLERYQRREFYRYNCTMNFGYFILEEEHLQMESTDEILSNLMDVDFKEKRHSGVIVDISGGGMKFRGQDELKENDQILAMLRLTSKEKDRQFQVRGNVIDCHKAQKSKDLLYECRVKFMIDDKRVQDEIIRFIFEEERRIRQKENG